MFKYPVERPFQVVQQGEGVPKMTANPPAIRRSKGESTWLLPLWRALPRRVRAFETTPPT
jgi:hypothetical protein